MLAQTLPHGKDIHCFLKVLLMHVHDPTAHLSALALPASVTSLSLSIHSVSTCRLCAHPE